MSLNLFALRFTLLCKPSSRSVTDSIKYFAQVIFEGWNSTGIICAANLQRKVFQPSVPENKELILMSSSLPVFIKKYI